MGHCYMVGDASFYIPYWLLAWGPNHFRKFGLEGRAKKAGQNETGKVKGRPKLDQLNFFA